MPKASSIEELLKHKPVAPVTPTALVSKSLGSSKQPSTQTTQTKLEKTKKGKRDNTSVTEQLSEKMSEIQIQQKEKIAQERASELGLPYLSLKGFPIAPEALSLVPKATAEKTRTLAFLKLGDEIRFATAKPGSETDALVKKIAEEQRAHVELYYISDYSFVMAFKMYAMLPEIKEVIYGYRIEEETLKKYEKEIINFKDLQEKIIKVSTTDVVSLMIGASLKSRASDIHVEAEEDGVKIRFRVDGVLRDVVKLARESWKQIIGRLKLLAGVKINVTDIPQDGRITIYLSNEKIDIRVNFLPTAFGESVVMRLLRPKALALEFDNLGIRGHAREILEEQIAKPNGIIVTTGPTGSGKTTTLYAILKKLNSLEVKIITLEDPIEYKLVGINQSQIDHAKHYDFAGGLRAILRQDPDIVMVGEIRDLETAEISIQAALTGHLVVSTIHTNSAAGAIPRFLSMGVKPFLLAPALNAVIGQRLVRRLCTECRIKAELTASQLEQVKRILSSIQEKSGFRPDLTKLNFLGPGPGCDACDHTGYKGQVGIYEVFTMSKEIELEILSPNVSEYTIKELAAKEGMIDMAQDGILKALDGLTSVEEVLSVVNVDTTVSNVTN